jgi:hypothetical protein
MNQRESYKLYIYYIKIPSLKLLLFFMLFERPVRVAANCKCFGTFKVLHREIHRQIPELLYERIDSISNRPCTKLCADIIIFSFFFSRLYVIARVRNVC